MQKGNKNMRVKAFEPRYYLLVHTRGHNSEVGGSFDRSADVGRFTAYQFPDGQASA
jgi:hypothetical protein